MDSRNFIFSKKWIEALKDKHWLNLKDYLYAQAWKKSIHWKNHHACNLLFSYVQNRRNIKTSAYIADLAKHFLAIGVGAIPGFSPATNNSMAPINKIQQAYIEHYNLKNYPPIIMQPNYFSLHQSGDPVYCSLQFINAIELALKANDRSSTLADLYATQSLLNKYFKEVRAENLNVQHTPLYDLAKKVRYESFHSNVGNYANIRKSEDIPNEDQNFSKILHQCNHSKFPTNGSFVRGCIRICCSSVETQEG